ncbi:MAG: Leucine-rich repeat (LRR) protein [Rhodothermales bacterium]|jgi:Leucine-rich repeat (LRR) protein
MPRFLILFGLVAGSAFGAIDFERQILPVLKDRCIDCHRAPYKDDNGRIKKPKADLRLDSPTWIRRGSEDGKVLEPGKPNQSTLYALVILPSNDDDIMPPKGAPLTDTQKQLLRTWIIEGASFGNWKGSDSEAAAQPKPVQRTPQPATVVQRSPLAKIGEALQFAPMDKLRAAADRGVLIETVGAGPFLRFEIAYNGPALSARFLLKYKVVFRHISELILRRSRVTDGELKLLAYMPHLTRADLAETTIDGSGLTHIRHLKFLESLNLYGTQINDDAIASIGQLKSLKRLYVWNSKISNAGVKKLQALLPDTEIISESPYE